MAAKFKIEIDKDAAKQIADSEGSIDLKLNVARRVEQQWKDNIHDITHATDQSIHVERSGNQVLVVAEGPESAWVFREFGTSTQRAEHPGRRAIREV